MVVNLNSLIRNPLVWIGALLLLDSTKSNPRKKKRKSTKKGQVRKTARKAYEPKKRKTKRKSKKKARKTKGKRKVSKAQFSKMVRANPNFKKATKDKMIREYRG